MTIRKSALCAMFGVVLIGSLAGCAGDPTGEYGPGPKENTGTLLGNRIGASLDEEDRQRAYAAEIQALEGGAAGAPVGWRSPNGRYGSVVPGPYYVDNGRRCRAFTETIYIDGRPQTARGVACRNPDGTWTPIG
jgi:surface antigen